jgi:hypothetical protein
MARLQFCKGEENDETDTRNTVVLRAERSRDSHGILYSRRQVQAAATTITLPSP